MLGGLLCVFAMILSAAAAPEETGVKIDAGYVDYQMKTGNYHHGGHVVVEAPGVLVLTCEDLVAEMAPSSATNSAAGRTPPAASSSTTTNSANRISVLTARTNVVIDVIQMPSTPAGVTNVMRFYCDTAVYTATNELVTLIGNPRMEGGPVQHADAEIMTYDLATGLLRARGGYHSTIKGGVLKDSGLFRARTNSPAVKPKQPEK
jgi:lipopolysaccharide export system protein LptA